jgi:hypothetical protein
MSILNHINIIRPDNRETTHNKFGRNYRQPMFGLSKRKVVAMFFTWWLWIPFLITVSENPSSKPLLSLGNFYGEINPNV